LIFPTSPLILQIPHFRRMMVPLSTVPSIQPTGETFFFFFHENWSEFPPLQIANPSSPRGYIGPSINQHRGPFLSQYRDLCFNISLVADRSSQRCVPEFFSSEGGCRSGLARGPQLRLFFRRQIVEFPLLCRRTTL